MLDAGWKFDNSYARLPERFFSNVLPTPVRAPKLAVLNRKLAATLGLDEEALRSDEGVAVMAGNEIPDGAEPIAQAYAGHQFGYFTMLGDGRAVLLGEHITPSGERVDIQLKGSGRTPYSRGGDGRAALGPMLREYIVSEAMHALGIPTTRSLAVVTTGETIVRETELPGAVLTRVASSHLRVGTFQYAAQWGTIEELRALADYALERHFPGFEAAENRYLFLLEQVIERQAELIAKWQLVGFVHGVMNTDNMTISGETIDYGPCAFMDTYSPATVFSSIDTEGRYAYGNQPYIGGWNLARFAESLLPLLDENEEKAIALAQEALDQYPKRYHRYWLEGMRAKLGLTEEQEGDEALVADLLRMMEAHCADYTNTFRALTLGEYTGMALFDAAEFREWHERWQTRISQESVSKEEAYERMRRHNPAVIPRNHRVEEALAAAVNGGDYSVMNRLLQALSDPYAYSPEQEEYAELPPPSDQPYRTFCGT
ncbi:protein adenylyltransferase SelO [Geobacillus jurassicus]|uniref:Protein nucleotidyltransferase YdiU n=1 Tax=Geobacillus jurassicus TaxID=235932 RepID=A0ABV6GWH3_9BACL|nr:YdiU family protein [Geobacillus jurassicus]